MNTRRTGSEWHAGRFTRRTAVVVLVLCTTWLPSPVRSTAVEKRAGIEVLRTKLAHDSGVDANLALRAFVDEQVEKIGPEKATGTYDSDVLVVETAPLTPDLRGASVRVVVHRIESAELFGYSFLKREERIGEKYEQLDNVPNKSGARFIVPPSWDGGSVLLIFRLRTAPGRFPRDDQLRDLVTLELGP